MAGALQRDQRKRKTEVIPEDIAAKLFNYAEQTVRQAENLISVWEGAEAIKAQAILEGRPRHIYDQLVSDYLEQMGVPPKLRINKTILEVRYACLFLIGLVTGMRIEEILSLKVGCFYTSEKDGDTFGWIRGRSTKTHIGDCEWMAPIDIVQTAVGVLERISAPLRDEATARAAALQRQLEDDKTPTETRITLLMELDQIRLHADHLFISHTHKKHNDVRLITTKTASARIAALPKQVGLKWRLHSHQFRATFAVFVSGHVLGDLRYLKKHYKHWSMDMTLLYAMNTKQDEELYEEIAKRYSEYTARVVDRWLDEKTKLSGGAAQRIIDYRRGGEVKTFKSRKEMVETLSDQIVLRSNGTSWCMADRSGCGGMGIIEKGRCVTCAEGTIEADIHAVAWRNIHVQQTELLQLQDIGPGGRQRVIRDLRIAEKVLTDLGLDFTPALISDEQGETSEDG